MFCCFLGKERSWATAGDTHVARGVPTEIPVSDTCIFASGQVVVEVMTVLPSTVFEIRFKFRLVDV